MLLKLHKFCLAIVCLLLIACETNMNMDFTPPNNLLVINSIINNEQEIKFEVSQSKSVLENDSIAYLDNAQIKLFCNNKQISTITKGKYGIYSSGIKAELGKSYNIEVTAPGFSPVSADVIVPKKPQIVSYEVSEDSIGLYSKNAKIKLAFEGNMPQYYILKIQAYINKMYKEGVGNVDIDDIFDYAIFWNKTKIINLETPISTKETIDMIIGHHNNAEDYNALKWIAFSSEYFEEKTGELKISISTFDLNTERPVHILLSEITEDYYLYLRSTELNKKISDSPFAEPVHVHNNIKNGIGIFGAEAIARDSVYLK